MKLCSRIYYLTIALSLACGGENDSGSQVLSSIEINESPFKLDIDEIVTLTVTGRDQNGKEIAITDEILWSSSGPNATVDKGGTVTGLVVGDVTITASVEDLSSSMNVRVWDSAAPRTEIYVTDAARFNNGGPYKVIRYDEDGGFAETLISSNLSWPQDIVFLEDKGTMLVSNLSSNSIEEFDINTGAYKGTFADVPNGPTRMKIGSDDLLYVLQWNNSAKVLRYNLDGTLVGEFTSIGVNQAIGMDWDSDGNLYVSSFQGGFVRKFNSEGIDQGNVIESNLQGPTNVWVTESEEILVLDWKAGQIQKFGLDGSFIETFATGLSQPEGIDRLPNGNYIIGNGQASTLSIFNSEGELVSNLFSGGFGGLIQPNGVVVRQVNQ